MGISENFSRERKKILVNSDIKIFNWQCVALLLGIITPFCTCSAIPLFLGFLEVGVPLGINFSFLVASPPNRSVVCGYAGRLFGGVRFV
ncbi:MAG TPA: hypothetical protein DD451_00250 [Candidatus Moranbacteria bacterium]|nr:hypothetical protein [Candidatus Moranbacteria bacterium]